MKDNFLFSQHQKPSTILTHLQLNAAPLFLCWHWPLRDPRSATVIPFHICYVKVQVKRSLYRSGQALMVPGGWGSQISRQSVHEGGKVVSPMHRPSLPQEIFLVLFSVRRWVDPRAIVRPEGLCQRKIPLTSSGIEPATFRLVEQCLNRLRHRVHLHFLRTFFSWWWER